MFRSIFIFQETAFLTGGVGEALGQKQHAREDYSRTSYSLGDSKHKYTSVQLECRLSTGWV